MAQHSNSRAKRTDSAVGRAEQGPFEARPGDRNLNDGTHSHRYTHGTLTDCHVRIRSGDVYNSILNKDGQKPLVKFSECAASKAQPPDL